MMKGKMGRSLFGMMGLVCACVWAWACVFLINTTMKVGCAKASGTLKQSLLAAYNCYDPIHTTSIIQCLMYLEKYLDELWTKRQKKKSIKVCIFSQRVFQWNIYQKLCICLIEGSLCDFIVWKGVNLWCLPWAGIDSQSVK